MRIESESVASLPMVLDPQPRKKPPWEQDGQARETQVYEPPPPLDLRGHLIDRYI